MTTIIFGIGGIGGALARRLVLKGRPVHLVSRSSEKLQALSLELGNSPFTSLDCSNPEAVETAVKAIVASGPVHGLVYAVGSIPLKPLKGTSIIEFQNAMALNFMSAAMSVKAATSALSTGPIPGSVVLFSTVAASQGFPNHCAIAAAKGAIEAFTRSAASELSPKIRINCIAPSLTDTPLASRMTSSEAMRKSLGEVHHTGRLGPNSNPNFALP